MRKVSEHPIFDQIRSMIHDRPTMERNGTSDGEWCVEREFNTPLNCSRCWNMVSVAFGPVDAY